MRNKITKKNSLKVETKVNGSQKIEKKISALQNQSNSSNIQLINARS